MKPVDRSELIWQHLSKINAMIRKDGKLLNIPQAIEADECVNCDGESLTFPDELSKEEYRLTGLCQKCQKR